MNMTRCSRGHFYDRDKFSRCPQCYDDEDVTRLNDVDMTRCRNGHFYDRNKYSECPFCNDHTDEVKLVTPESVEVTYDWHAKAQKLMYLDELGMLDMANREHTVTVDLDGKMLSIRMYGRENADDAIDKLVEAGYLSWNNSYAFVDWPESNSDVSTESRPESACVCELPNRVFHIRDNQCVTRLYDDENIRILYGCPNASSLDFSDIQNRRSVEEIDYGHR